MAKVRWTEEGAAWLEAIYDYISGDNPDAALRVVRGIYALIESLEDFPRRGYLLHSTSTIETRVVLFGQYRIVYEYDSDDMVVVLGVFHSALDIERYL